MNTVSKSHKTKPQKQQGEILNINTHSSAQHPANQHQNSYNQHQQTIAQQVDHHQKPSAVTSGGESIIICSSSSAGSSYQLACEAYSEANAANGKRTSKASTPTTSRK